MLKRMAVKNLECIHFILGTAVIRLSARGFSSQADTAYIAQTQHGCKLKDGERMYIPTEEKRERRGSPNL
jgi:hypothetical protein